MSKIADLAKKAYTQIAYSQAGFQLSTKAILVSAGINPFDMGYYFAFNDKLFGLTSKFGNGDIGKQTVIQIAYIFVSEYVMALGTKFDLLIANKILDLYRIPAFIPSVSLQFDIAATISIIRDLQITPQTLNPNGNSTTDLLSVPLGLANWECVSFLYDYEPNDDTSYVYSDDSGQLEDLYTLEPNLIPASSTINSVTETFRGRKYQIKVSSCSLIPHIKTHGIDYAGTSRALTVAWTTFSQTWILNPNTLLPWTKAEIDALIAGIGILNVDGDKSQGACTWVKIAVDYTPNAY